MPTDWLSEPQKGTDDILIYSPNESVRILLHELSTSPMTEADIVQTVKKEGWDFGRPFKIEHLKTPSGRPVVRLELDPTSKFPGSTASLYALFFEHSTLVGSTLSKFHAGTEAIDDKSSGAEDVILSVH